MKLASLVNVRVLAVDDDPAIRDNLRVYLEDCGSVVTTAENGRAGLAALRAGMPDIVLVDLRMPEVDGMEFIRNVCGAHPLLPVVVVSGTGVMQDVIDAMRCGAWDFVTKPLVDMQILDYVMGRCLSRAQLLRENEAYRQGLESKVAERTADLEASYRKMRRLMRATVASLSGVTDMQSSFTGMHQQRVSILARTLAENMGFTAARVEGVETAGLLHDIGLLHVPSEFLSKPGALTKLEWAFVYLHPRSAYDVLSRVPFEQPVADIVLQHHERMDGSGYPQGLQGEAILPEARIVAVADVVEAMLSHRPYRPARSLDEVMEELRGHRGTLYCPAAADAAMGILARAQSVEAVFKEE